MPLATCPERLKKYIKRLNQESGVAAQHLRLILQVTQDARQDNKDPDPYVVTLPSTVRIDLTDFSWRISNDLTDVLRAIDPPELIERIRECPAKGCGDLFWAGRKDKKACDKHVDVWRQRQHRREVEKRETAAADERRKQAARETLFAMGTIKLSVIRAIMDDGPDTFAAIDARVWQICNDASDRPIRRTAVRKAAHELYRAGFLHYRESADRRDACGFSRFDRYPITVKLDRLWSVADLDLD